jgi:peptidoglycan/LPS O-acetylase OafA/YrhL
LISLALAYVASSVGASRRGSWCELFGNLALLQDISSLKGGVWVDTYSGNTALWSLSYEWWFYMMFYPIVGLLYFSPRRQMLMAFFLSVLGFVSYQACPNQISLFLGYFFIWWAGVELSREYTTSATITWSRQRLPILLLACLVVLWSLPVWLLKSSLSELRLGVAPVLQLRHFAGALAFIVSGIVWYRTGFTAFRFLLGPFAVLAPISYALYAMHMPVLQILDAAGVEHPLAKLAIGLIVLLPACYLVEVMLQRRVNRWFDRLTAPSA